MSNTISSGYSATMMQGMNRMQRPDPAKMAEDLFSRLDTEGKGYIEAADLQAAMQSVNATNESGASSDEVFASLDSDSDGKITQEEMSGNLTKLFDDFFQSMRKNATQGGMPPMPPPGGGAGFTEEELTNQLSGIGAADSQAASFISSILDNFSTADSDADGKVSFLEARSFEQSSQGTSATSLIAGTSSTSSAENSGDQVTLQIMKLLEAYGVFGESSASSGLSVTA